MFREARSGDFEDILRLYRQLQPTDPVLKDGSDAATFEQILDSPGLHIFVLELDGKIAATTYLNVIPNLTRSASPYAVIENVVVEESLRARDRQLQRSLSPAQINTAVADTICKRRHNVIGVWAAVEAADRRRLIQANKPALEALRAANAARLRTASGVVGHE